MAAEESASAEARARHEAPREESLWDSFTRADMKLLRITFAGTLAANVVTVMVVATVAVAGMAGLSLLAINSPAMAANGPSLAGSIAVEGQLTGAPTLGVCMSRCTASRRRRS
jgi:hypothetical protein